MLLCPHCGYTNRPGTLFCSECARTLDDSGNAPFATKRLEIELDPSSILLVAGTARFNAEYYLIIQIQDASDPIVLRPSRRILFGRSSRSSMRMPDIDLTPYDALEKGVSSIHAAINCAGDQLTVQDMGSVNGTFLNGERLPANREHLIRDGDEIRLGKLVFHAYFQNSA